MDGVTFVMLCRCQFHPVVVVLELVTLMMGGTECMLEQLQVCQVRDFQV